VSAAGGGIRLRVGGREDGIRILESVWRKPFILRGVAPDRRRGVDPRKAEYDRGTNGTGDLSGESPIKEVGKKNQRATGYEGKRGKKDTLDGQTPADNREVHFDAVGHRYFEPVSIKAGEETVRTSLTINRRTEEKDHHKERTNAVSFYMGGGVW